VYTCSKCKNDLLIPGSGGGEMMESRGAGAFKYDIFDTL
jgi:hypothetical protein